VGVAEGVTPVPGWRSQRHECCWLKILPPKIRPVSRPRKRAAGSPAASYLIRTPVAAPAAPPIAAPPIAAPTAGLPPLSARCRQDAMFAHPVTTPPA
jgi:hypothetical protein